jgi:hypothetical protein
MASYKETPWEEFELEVLANDVLLWHREKLVAAGYRGNALHLEACPYGSDAGLALARMVAYGDYLLGFTAEEHLVECSCG